MFRQDAEHRGNDMSADQNSLRAIVTRCQHGLQAQLLELDIAVQGQDEHTLLAEFAHAITVSYEIAMAHGEAPFSSVGEPPKAIREKWRASTEMKCGYIELRDEVALSLATALRWRKPVGSVAFEDAVAA